MSYELDLIGKEFGILKVVNRVRYKDRVGWECLCKCGKVITVSTAGLRRKRLGRNLGRTCCGCNKKEDISGKRFGLLTAIKIYDSQNGNTRWECNCECGGKSYLAISELKLGRITNCSNPIHYMKDLTGERFGKLKVIELLPKNGNREREWLCQCDCGTKHKVSTYNLKKGLISSCGCIKSRAELIVGVTLTELGINFEKEKTFKNLKYKSYLRFDFYISYHGISFIIECHGEQHYYNQDRGYFRDYKNLQIRDKMKEDYCKLNKIPFFIIRFDENPRETLLEILNKIEKAAQD